MCCSPACDWEQGLSASLFRELVAQCADGIVIADADQRIVAMNPAAGSLFGYAPESVLGVSLDGLLPARFRGMHADAISALGLDAGAGRYHGAGSGFVPCLHADGHEFMAEVSILRMSGEGHPAYAAIIRDRRWQQEREQRWRELASTDPLTGALNRRAFTTSAATMAAAAQRRGDAFAIALLDIDHFKAVNDRFGHTVGDEVIQGVLERIRANLRDADLIGRWGGEEFLMVISEADEEGASVAAERVRAAVERAPVYSASLGDAVAITVSLGVAVTAEPSGCVTPLVERADQAMYGAKREGRNRARVVALESTGA